LSRAHTSEDLGGGGLRNLGREQIGGGGLPPGFNPFKK